MKNYEFSVAAGRLVGCVKITGSPTAHRYLCRTVFSIRLLSLQMSRNVGRIVNATFSAQPTEIMHIVLRNKLIATPNVMHAKPYHCSQDITTRLENSGVAVRSIAIVY